MKCSICGKGYWFKYNPRKVCSDPCMMELRSRIGMKKYKKWVALKKKNAIIKRSLIAN